MSRRTTLIQNIGVLILVMAATGSARATVHPKVGRHEIKAILSIIPGEKGKMFINPMARSRYTLVVTNTKEVTQWLKKERVFDRVEATVEISTPTHPNWANVTVRQVKLSPKAEIPFYAGNLEEVRAPASATGK